MTDRTDDQPRPARRMFLKGAGAAVVAAPIAAASAQTLLKPTSHQIGPRYKETEHMRRFYELNRR